MSAPAKKPAKKSVPKKKPAQHPVYKEMIVAAIKALANKQGSSKLAISKYIVANYKVGDRHDAHLKTSLLRGIASGVVVKKSGLGCSGSFKLPKAVAGPKKAAPAAKKRASSSKKSAPKKKPSTPKKKVAPKKKSKVAPKKKATPKKKGPVKRKVKKATPKKAVK